MWKKISMTLPDLTLFNVKKDKRMADLSFVFPCSYKDNEQERQDHQACCQKEK